MNTPLLRNITTATRLPQNFRLCLLLTIFSAAAVALTPAPLRAQTFTTLYTFTDSTDGSLPGGLVQAATGAIYGFAGYGGNTNDCEPILPPYGCGNVFQISQTGKLTTLYSFQGSTDGQEPTSLIVSNGKLYGTTSQGGTSAGTAFEIASPNTLSAVYDFQTGEDATHPLVALTPVANGSFYGTGYFGGTANDGAVFHLTFNSQGGASENVIYSFKGAPSDGESPNSPLIIAGNTLYGTTTYGGPGDCNNGFAEGCGTFFKIDASGETVLHSFTGPDGSYPGKIIAAGNGNFYGVTSSGGSTGFGTIFEITPAGAVTTLFNFTGTNGASPGGLERDSSGNLFGTTYIGGADGDGTIFELSPNGQSGWTETVLYSFTGQSDGTGPQPPFVLDFLKRTIYGVAIEGGNLSCFAPYGCGTAFKLTY